MAPDAAAVSIPPGAAASLPDAADGATADADVAPHDVQSMMPQHPHLYVQWPSSTVQTN